jgi:G protein beta subunit-like protein
MMRGSSLTTHFEPLHKLRAHAGAHRRPRRRALRGRGAARRLSQAARAGKYVLKCLLSPDVRQLATTSADKTVKLWNLDGFTLDRTLVGAARGARCPWP